MMAIIEKYLVVNCGICGSCLVICDILARCIVSTPTEIPVRCVSETFREHLFKFIIYKGAQNEETAFKKMAYITFCF